MRKESASRGLILSFPESREVAARVAAAADLDFDEIAVHQFPDGESRIALPCCLPEDVHIYRSLDNPNEKLVELILAAATSRQLGAVRLALVAPYLCYMRQDKAFNPGEAVSQRVIGKLLADYFDAVVSVDPHLHRVHRLADAIPLKSAVSITAAEAMSGYLEGRLENPILIGPDEESEQWVASIALRSKLEYYVASKERIGDKEVVVSLPRAAYEGRHVVLVDDIASTGRTLAAASRELSRYHPASITVMVTHALFVGDALAKIKAAGVDEVWSCDSIVHPSNRISLAGSLAQALRKLNQDALS